ncbi:hypothetical protein CK203_017481 [Vitis vinifera]|uniref:Uncharacterized protein n=1 Tax=Vitis vinifera TaxID=29760 RepID=A0A438IY09_VITVI|nr:hypothetical protein CK203_017481 [Vitis vinifera]
MAAKEQEKEAEEFVYRISTAQEWEELQKAGACYGGQLDKSTGCIHLSNLHQVQSTLQNFFLKTQAELYLLQVDSKKHGDENEHQVGLMKMEWNGRFQPVAFMK